MSRIIWDRLPNRDTLKQETLDFGRATKRGTRNGLAVDTRKSRDDNDSDSDAEQRQQHPPKRRRTHNRNGPNLEGNAENLLHRAQTWVEGKVQEALNAEPDRTGLDPELCAEGLLGDAYRSVSLQLFAGLSLQFNAGIILKERLSVYHLEHAVKYYGGKVCYFPKRGITHVVCTNLSAAKMDKVARRAGRAVGGVAVVVTPQWVLDSLRAGRRLPEGQYSLLAAQNVAAQAGGGGGGGNLKSYTATTLATNARGATKPRTLQSMAKRKGNTADEVIVL